MSTLLTAVQKGKKGNNTKALALKKGGING